MCCLLSKAKSNKLTFAAESGVVLAADCEHRGQRSNGRGVWISMVGHNVPDILKFEGLLEILEY